MKEVRTLSVPGQYNQIPQITHFISEAAEAAGLSNKANFHCQMSVDEACTNIIEHAYGGELKGNILITCTNASQRFVIQIEDTGQPFDPDAVPKHKVVEDINDLEPGGIGLHLMHQLMDEVTFEFIGERNILTMVKLKSRPPDEQQWGAIDVTHTASGIAIAAPHGRLQSAVAPDLQDNLMALIDSGDVWVVVDMERVEYISSRGLKSFVNLWKYARSQEGDLVFGAMVPSVYETFDVVGFSQIFNIYPSVALAVDALEGRIGNPDE